MSERERAERLQAEVERLKATIEALAGALRANASVLLAARGTVLLHIPKFNTGYIDEALAQANAALDAVEKK